MTTTPTPWKNEGRTMNIGIVIVLLIGLFAGCAKPIPFPVLELGKPIPQECEKKVVLMTREYTVYVVTHYPTHGTFQRLYVTTVNDTITRVEEK